jgi:SCP-2 sterol transfer family
MATRKSRQAVAADSSLKPALSRFAHRVSNAVPAARGGIHIQCTDCDEEYSLDGLGRSARVSDKAGAAPVVRVTGPSAVLREVLEGRLEASQALVRGGIRVRGDLQYLEQVLRDVGLLNCE